jgi:pimeloyl-ACP methyl ester carboxylesterase
MLRIISLILILIITGCVSDSNRGQLADNVAAQSGMVKSLVKTDGFTLTSYKKIKSAGKPVTIYVEGDGFAWAERGRLSSNPTPKSALMIELAALDASENVVYLARPCQYTPFELNKTECKPKFWSDSRFSESVIASMNQAVDAIEKEASASQINLIGYSGGGAVAVLLAARRNDVASIRTVAGNLDTVAVNNHHKVDQMHDSLNPADYVAKISHIPQRHFSGANDVVVPQFIAKDFASKIGNCAKISVVNNATHFAGWKDKWKSLLAEPLNCG